MKTEVNFTNAKIFKDITRKIEKYINKGNCCHFGCFWLVSNGLVDENEKVLRP